MSARRKPIVIILLLVFLAAVLANMFFVYHAYHAAVTAINAASPPDTIGDEGGTGAYGLHGNAASGGRSHMEPPWYGDMTIEKAAQGGYDLTVFATGPGKGLPVALTSFEVDVRRPDAEGSGLKLQFSDAENEKHAAHVDFPEKGDWEIRVRLHRDLQTFEFTRRFTAE